MASEFFTIEYNTINHSPWCKYRTTDAMQYCMDSRMNQANVVHVIIAVTSP